MANIHPLATVHPNAKLGENVEVGPYAYIEEHVEIGEGSKILPHATIFNYVKIMRQHADTAIRQILDNLKETGDSHEPPETKN